MPVESAPVPLPAAGADVGRVPDLLDGQEREALLTRVEEVVQQVLLDLEPEGAEVRRPGPGRPRVLPAFALWGGVLVCVLRGMPSQRAVWRLPTARRLWHYPRFALTDQAVSNRLADADTTPLELVFAAVGRLVAARLVPWAARDLAPFASEVVALDETTLAQVARTLPALRAVPPGDDALLPGKLAAVFDLRTQLFRRVEHVPDPRQNEKVAARDLLAGLAAGALILADLGYFGSRWFDDLTDRGFWWVSRLREKTSSEVLHVHYQRNDTLDAIVWLGTYRADRAKHAVRLGQFRHGAVLRRYVTNVLDPRVLPPAEVARLYARRWDLELAFKLAKRHLGLHLLWSARPGVVLHQVWAVLTIAQIVQALRVEIAGQADVDVFEVSVPLPVEYLPLRLEQGEDPVAFFVAEGRRLAFIRPSSRTVIHAPTLPPTEVQPRPPDLVLIREPRYAGKDGGPRAA
jgi:DDE family transposase